MEPVSYQLIPMDATPHGTWRLTTLRGDKVTDIQEGPARVIAVIVVHLLLGKLFGLRQYKKAA